MTEAELIQHCKKGEPKAQRMLYDQFSDRLYRVAFRYMQEQTQAEDVLIVAFTKIYRKIEGFEYQGEGSLTAWMRKIVVNEALMNLRKRNNFHLTESLDDATVPPDLSAFQHVEAEYLYQLIVSLPPGYRTVFNLSVIEGYDHGEIAALLGITESTSRTQLFKAKLLLQKKIEKERYDYGT